ncbi:MAG: anti-sigma factor family protein [Actinomycetota bacterium]
MSIPCDKCCENLVLFIDNEIDDSATFNEIAFHLQDCQGCRGEMESQRAALNLIQSLLTRSCCESAPSSLQEQIALRLAQLANQEMLTSSQSEIITQYRRTEITIDGQTSIEIETSHEIRRDFPF